MKDNNNYSIGVVDYLGRFDDYFVPLIKSLVKIFPDKEIICILNGHHNKEAQIMYLKKATSFLSAYPNVRYITYEDHQSLAKCWNQIILMSRNESVLILNDDLKINALFRDDFEKQFLNEQDFFIINNSWSHFLVSKNIIKKIGWFEERLKGIGWEDGDYMLRMAYKKLKIKNIKCRGIKNIVAPPTDASWSKVSDKEGKYSKSNKEFFDKKWRTNYTNGDGNYDISLVFNDLIIMGTQIMDTPTYYDYSLLSANKFFETNSKYNKKSLKYYIIKDFVINILKILKNKIKKYYD